MAPTIEEHLLKSGPDKDTAAVVSKQLSTDASITTASTAPSEEFSLPTTAAAPDSKMAESYSETTAAMVDNIDLVVPDQKVTETDATDKAATDTPEEEAMVDIDLIPTDDNNKGDDEKEQTPTAATNENDDNKRDSKPIDGNAAERNEAMVDIDLLLPEDDTENEGKAERKGSSLTMDTTLVNSQSFGQATTADDAELSPRDDDEDKALEKAEDATDDDDKATNETADMDLEVVPDQNDKETDATDNVEPGAPEEAMVDIDLIPDNNEDNDKDEDKTPTTANNKSKTTNDNAKTDDDNGNDDAMVEIGLLPETDEPQESGNPQQERTGSSMTLDSTHSLNDITTDDHNSATKGIIAIGKKRGSGGSSALSLLSASDDDSDSDEEQGVKEPAQPVNLLDESDASIRNASCHGMIQGAAGRKGGRGLLLTRDTSTGAMSHNSSSSSLNNNGNAKKNAPGRRPQMARSISNPRLQLSPKMARRTTSSSNASLSSSFSNKKACAPKRPTRLHAPPKRAKSESRLRVELSHSTGTGTAERPDDNNHSSHSHNAAGVKRSTSDKGKLAAMLDSHRNRQQQQPQHSSDDDDGSVLSESSFQSRHTFKPPESINPLHLGSLSNLDISMVDHNIHTGNNGNNHHDNDNNTVTTFSSRSTNRSNSVHGRKQFPPGFTANHHRVTCAKKDAIPEEVDDATSSSQSSQSMFSTFSSNLNYLGTFVEQRQRTFATNMTVVAELMTNQRELTSIDEEEAADEAQDASEELRMQERSHRYTQDEHSLATYLWGGGGFARK